MKCPLGKLNLIPLALEGGATKTMCRPQNMSSGNVECKNHYEIKPKFESLPSINKDIHRMYISFTQQHVEHKVIYSSETLN